MTSPVWMNIILALPFLLAFIGIPLWMTWKHTDTAPDFSAARDHLAAKAGPSAPAAIRTIQPPTRGDDLAASAA